MYPKDVLEGLQLIPGDDKQQQQIITKFKSEFPTSKVNSSYFTKNSYKISHKLVCHFQSECGKVSKLTFCIDFINQRIHLNHVIQT